MTRERSIIFSGPMVRAILAGRKTQTRRVLKPQPAGLVNGMPYYEGRDAAKLPTCPYGKAGDKLWVREACYITKACEDGAPLCDPVVIYRADGCEDQPNGYVSRPSIHMPRWASRITLEVVSVRVERLQDISEANAEAEGVSRCCPFGVCNGGGFIGGDENCRCADITPTQVFAHRWDSINGKRGYSWDSNPWVWAIEFRRVQQ